MNKEQIKGYYRQATKMANTLYDYMVETFENAPCVVYCIEIEKWHNHVTVEAWACIGNGFAPDDVREMVGSVSMNFCFASWRHEKTSDFIKQVKEQTNAFFQKVKMQGLTEEEQ